MHRLLPLAPLFCCLHPAAATDAPAPSPSPAAAGTKQLVARLGEPGGRVAALAELLRREAAALLRESITLLDALKEANDSAVDAAVRRASESAARAALSIAHSAEAVANAAPRLPLTPAPTQPAVQHAAHWTDDAARAQVAAARARCEATVPTLPDNGSSPAGYLDCHERRYGGGPPCLPDAIFYAKGYAMCKVRNRDDQWPTWDPWLRRTPETKGMADVEAVLRGRRVVLVGASVAKQSYYAAQCALRSIGAPPSRAAGWRHWGWANLARDGGGCSAQLAQAIAEKGDNWLQYNPLFYKLVLESKCHENSTDLDTMLSTADVVIAGYHLDHHSKDWTFYEAMMRTLFGKLSAWAAGGRGRVAFVREHSPQHFQGVGGSYDRDAMGRTLRKHGAGWCICQPQRSPHAEAFNAQTAQLVAEFPGVTLMRGFLEGTRERWNMHPGSACGRRPPKVEGVVTGTQAAPRSCCDCTHWCYTPLLWDTAFFTPLYWALQRADGAHGLRP